MLAIVLIMIAGVVITSCVIGLKFYKNNNNRLILLLIGGTSLILGLVVLINSIFFTVGARHVGVKFDSFGGGIRSQVYQQGVHLKAPWQSVTNFNTATQSYNMTDGQGDTVTCVTNEGLEVGLSISIFYNIIPDKAPLIKSELGEDGVYQESVVRPLFRSAIRNVVAQHTADEVYSSQKPVIENEILENLNITMNPRYIQVQAVLLRDIILPEQLTSAITAKLQAQQEALTMKFVLQTAEQERQRKVIESEGIAEANEIIAASLTESYLHWYWLDGLNKSDAVIYVPTEGGLPLFKDIDQVP